jgi:hypothetical protein
MTMTLSSSIYIQTSIILSIFAVGICFFAFDAEMALGVLVSSILLSLNLWGWIWMIKQTILIMKNGGSNAVLTLFSTMKFVMLMTSLLAIMFFFGTAVVAVSNTIIVLTLLMSTFYFEYLRRGTSNEC